ncbi:ABC transporter substrate-binding protein [Vibrio viridaestus]|uniref:Probable sugar-binding periplasmic protein n=1 Tax=Vibrio viridaestus TaxID=2487322 RepID=A0A3N9U1C2_9VIBR|nr:ABC transporter substrate-binding protein [Vibrio viridaestus]RQW63212.1 carbohydrate ABC transporter substrate-binding protein [Vibrio viridaestus]
MKYVNRILMLIIVICFSTSVFPGEVEVLHWWTSGSEAKSIDLLKDKLRQQGHHWKDFAIEGGGGESAMTVLATRAISGNPPSAAQIKGKDIQDWASLGLLANMNDVANQQHWDQLLPPLIANIMRSDGRYVGVPLNIHRINWMWVNSAIFQKFHLEVPHSLDDFFKVAKTLKSKGILPLAHGGEPWQDATLFEVVALDTLGVDGYRKAFVDLDSSTLNSPKMVEVFSKFKQLSSYVDTKSRGRNWNQASSLLASGKAAMQIMGDWAKGEFDSLHLRAGEDYECTPAFNTGGAFIYNVDSIVFFQLEKQDDIEAQKALAKTVLTPDFQRVFNFNKGSIPVRKDVSLEGFDECALQSHYAFIEASQNNTLVPSMAHGMATTSYVERAMYDVISSFFHDPNSDPKLGAYRLSKAVQAAM